MNREQFVIRRMPPSLIRSLLASSWLLAALLASTAYGTRAAAQAGPDRPKLPAGADTNDWQAYQTYGTSILRQSPAFAERYFYWASRLHPGRAEPLFARWVAFWMRDPGRFERYLDQDSRVIGDADIARVDSLRLRAMWRNPLVHRGLELLLLDELPGVWSSDARTRARLKYTNGDYAEAARLLREELARRPGRRPELRFDLALVLVAAGQLDSAAAELGRFVENLGMRDRDVLVRVYESREVIEYARGLVLAVNGDAEGATRAMQAALTENLAFAPAHEALGRLALAARDTAVAVRELALAVELSPGDGWLRYQYGSALYSARRYAAAAEQFREAIRLEPYFADAYFGLAAALDSLGEPGASAAYGEYLARAPRDASPMRSRAEERMAALTAPSR